MVIDITVLSGIPLYLGLLRGCHPSGRLRRAHSGVLFSVYYHSVCAIPHYRHTYIVYYRSNYIMHVVW